MNFLVLQPLTNELLTAAVDLDQRCFGGLWTLDGYRRELASPNSEILTFRPVAPHLPSSIPPLLALGCYWAILEEAHITILGVDPGYQRQGLGQAMLWALLKSAYQRKLERATLEVRISNKTALMLYEKFGFREAGRRKRYYQDTGEDALILWRGGIQSPQFQQTLTDGWELIRDRLCRSGWDISAWDRWHDSQSTYLTR